MISFLRTTLAKRLFAVQLAVVLLWGACPLHSIAQDKTAPSTDALTPAADTRQDLIDKLNDLKTRLGQELELDATLKSKIEERLASAEASLKRITELNEQTLAFNTAAEQAADKAAKLQEKRTELDNQTPAVIPDDLELPAVEAKIREYKTALDKYKTQTTTLKTEEEKRVIRKPEIRNRLALIPQQRTTLTQQLDQPSIEGEMPLLTEAKRLELEIKLQLLLADELHLKAELAKLISEETANLIRLEQDLISKQTNNTELAVKALEARDTQLRQEMAQDAARRAEENQLSQNSLLKNSFATNKELADKSSATLTEIAQTKKKLGTKTDELRTLAKRLSNTQIRVKKIGLSSTVGSMLRKMKSELPDSRITIFEVNSIKDKIDDLQFDVYELDEQISDLDNEFLVKEIESNYGPQPPEKIQELSDEIAKLVKSRAELLSNLRKNKLAHSTDLEQLELVERQFVAQAEEFREYINERILWIRSNDVLFSTFNVDASDKQIFEPQRWRDAANLLVRDFRVAPLIYGGIAALALLLMFYKGRLRTEIDRQGEIAERGSCTDFWPTTRTLILTILVSISLPIVPLMLGLRLHLAGLGHSENLLGAVVPALLAVAWFAIPVEIFRRLCRQGGLAHKHFDWSDQAVRTLRNNLTWASPLGALLTFVVALFYFQDVTHRIDLVERIAFVIGLLGLTWFLYKCFNPRAGVFGQYLRRHDRSWANQTSSIWFGSILLLPISLAVMTVVGFYYTALNLAGVVYTTFVFATMVEIGRAMILRLILVRRRSAHIEAEKRKREIHRIEAERKANAAAVEGKGDQIAVQSISVEAMAAETQSEIEIEENATQASKAISLFMILVWTIGLWMIWADFLPALKALDEYTVWPGEIVTQSAEVDPGASESNSESTPNGSTPFVADSSKDGAVTTVASTHPVTVRDMLIFVLVAIVTLLSARSLPSSIEMLFLNQLPVDRSVRHAVKALISYAIFLVGTIVAFQSLSIGWSQVQWLATALTFGLAFGLQEIFANFVAGIILLFERPIRIGDWITVDNFTGVVTRIRTRATTIVNLDRKEFIIPNKDFITGRLINWTLSDALNRIDIKVGIAYGSNVILAKEILTQVANDHPVTVKDPPTSVIFEQFGDSSLNLTLRTFVPNVDCRMEVIDKLHTDINRALAEAGIEISFPQRDLHIRSVSEQVSLRIDKQD